MSAASSAMAAAAPGSRPSPSAACESELGPALLHGQGSGFHVAGHLRADSWQGREEVQLILEDASRAAG